MNKKMLFVAMAGLSFGVMAQQEPGAVSVNPEAMVKTDNTITDDRNAQSMIDDFLKSKKWSEGENTKGKGEKFFVSCGVGVIQAPRADRNYAASRVAAYNKAMLDAKKQMVEFLGIAIQTETEKTYKEGDFPIPAENKAKTADESDTSILGKVKMLVHAKLDAALKRNGVEPQKASKEEVAKVLSKELNSESYKKMISSVANSYVVGMQVCNSFEFTPSNKKGEVGVVAIWSPKLQQMAESMFTGGKMPTGLPKASIAEQVPTDPVVLLTTFGVQQKLDENGNLVLVSFGQEGAITDSPTSANAAVSKAQMNAQASIREFAGESVAVAKDMLNSETAKEFEDKTESYQNNSAFQEKVKATAAQMKISGIATLKKWKVKHPISEAYVYGVICTWSPQSAAYANELSDKMNSAPRPGSVQQPQATQAAKPEKSKEEDLKKKSFQGAGQSADSDAF
jgi:hypothetical protein